MITKLPSGSFCFCQKLQNIIILTFFDFPVDKSQEQFHNGQRKSKSKTKKSKVENKVTNKAEGGRSCGKTG